MPRLRSRVLVLGLNHPPEPTGISPYTGAMARGLVRRGYDTHVLTAHPHYPEWRPQPGYGQWTRPETVDGVAITRLRHYIPRRPSGARRAVSELSFGIRQALRPWGATDAVVAVSPALFASVVARARALITHPRTPFVVWVQDLYAVGLSETGMAEGAAVRAIHRIERWLLRRATRVVVIHERFVARIHADFGIPLDRIVVVRNWAHLSTLPDVDRDAVRTRLGWRSDEIIVLHAGNMGVKQGLDNVIEAARLAHRRRLPLRFVLLGDGAERERLLATAGTHTAVQFINTLNDHDFTAALQAADVLLVNERPGIAEMALPSKLTSYFAAGRPVLAATDPTGITADEVRRSGAGVVVPAGDPEALLDAAMRLARIPEKAAAYGRAGRRFRATVLHEDTAIAAFDALLSELIDAPPYPTAAVDDIGLRQDRAAMGG